jgi:hypothetical protein
MRNDALPSDLLQAFLLDQAYDGMECAAYFERAYALEVLAFEEELHFRLCRLLSLPLCSLQRFGSLRCRCEVCKGGVGEHWGAVDAGLYERVGGFDRGARQGT